MKTSYFRGLEHLRIVLSPILIGKEGERMAAKYNGFTDWEKPDKLEQIRKWASEGLTKAEIAHNMGISRDTFVEWRKKSPVISDFLKKGADDAIDKVENALFSAACSGNITAQIFFLKNRRPDLWKDKRDTEISGTGSVSFAWDGGKKKDGGDNG